MNQPHGANLSQDEANTAPKIVFGPGLADLGSTIRDAIAHRAYELFAARGYQHGNDLEDWLRAESELVLPLSLEVWQSEYEIVITAQVPGFRPEEIRVGIEPARVIVWGRPEPKQPDTHAYPVRATIALYQAIDLPAKVDASKASAQLSGELLKLTLPKLAHRSGVTKHER